eukprot:CAMPEP_0174820680 /NCGR_PEP_ID=MMETSP1107-20130205/4659_1 /TAXON_ID=36770 /ORGANISM="Paraphysomonas vestita, Strain GFlagA" /LENGTH=697 /DNA_ID=CAMNT_0016036475 /DNA_START=1216 /DNA_END=3309 /DNA_ORIENTATION=+
MSRVTKSDPNDWAKKRKEAMDRAKQLREERKHGIGEVDENHTFKPQINKRPQYLKKEEPVENVPYRDPNDVFEKPLPGGKGQYQYDLSSEQPLSSTPQPLSSYVKQNNNQNNNNNNQYDNRNDNRNYQNNSENGYKSKFMQQYDQNNNQNHNNHNNQNNQNEPSYQPPQRSKADIEAEDTFMNLLRGNQGTQSSGWNDSTDASIPAVPKKVSYRRRKPSDQNQPQNTSTNSVSSRPSPRQKQSEWNNDVGNGIPPLAPSQQYLRRDNIQSSPSNINRGGIDNSDSADVSQARSRLSLLKSKMRKADSGGDLRSLSANEKDRERQRSHPQRDHNEWDSSPAGGDQYIPNLQPKGGRRQQNNAPFATDYDNHSNNYNNNNYNNNNNNHNNGYENPAPSNRRVGEARQQLSQQNHQHQQQNQNQYAPPQDNYNQPPRRQNQRQQPPPQQSYQSAYDEENDYDDNNNYGGRGQRPNSGNNNHNNNNNNNNNNAFGNESNLEEDIGMGEQLECPDCGRKFNRIPYEKHVKICNKIFGQKRKVFDSKKMRMIEDLEKLQQEEKLNSRFNKKKGNKQSTANRAGGAGAGGGDNRPIQGEKSSKWKEQSKQFREAMKMARLAKKAEETGGPMPEYVPSAPDPSLIRCQHCGRSFNERAAERHIPLCSNIKAKPTSLKRGSGGAGGKTGTIPGSNTLGASKPAKRR